MRVLGGNLSGLPHLFSRLQREIAIAPSFSFPAQGEGEAILFTLSLSATAFLHAIFIKRLLSRKFVLDDEARPDAGEFSVAKFDRVGEARRHPRHAAPRRATLCWVLHNAEMELRSRRETKE